MEKIKILVFDDELSEISKIYIGLLLKNYLVEATTDPGEIATRAERMKPDITIVNADVKGFDAHYVCKLVKKEMKIPIILLLEKDSATDLKIDSCDADEIIYKPVDIEELERKIDLLSIKS